MVTKSQDMAVGGRTAHLCCMESSLRIAHLSNVGEMLLRSAAEYFRNKASESWLSHKNGPYRFVLLLAMIQLGGNLLREKLKRHLFDDSLRRQTRSGETVENGVDVYRKQSNRALSASSLFAMPPTTSSTTSPAPLTSLISPATWPQHISELSALPRCWE